MWAFFFDCSFRMLRQTPGSSYVVTRAQAHCVARHVVRETGGTEPRVQIKHKRLCRSGRGPSICYQSIVRGLSIIHTSWR